MKHYACYNIQGYIESVVIAPHEEYVRMQGHAFMPCSPSINDATHYVALRNGNPEIREKITLIPDYRVDGLRVIFVGLPPGIALTVGNLSCESDGTEDIIEFDMPGEYTIRLLGLAEYTEERVEVHVG